jgi:TRAP-type uncharacterized transport system substrate-binding protein
METKKRLLTRFLWMFLAPLVGLTCLGVAFFVYYRTPRERTYHLSMTGGDALGTRHQVALALQTQLAHIRIHVDIRETPGSEEALDKVNDHALDLALVQGGLHVEDRPNVRQVATLQVEPLHLVVKKEFADKVAANLTALEGKTVAVGARGSGTHSLATEVLAFVGLHPQEPGRTGGYQPLALDRKHLYDNLERSKLPDAVFVVSAMPSDLAKFLVNERDYRVVPLPFAEAFALDSLAVKAAHPGPVSHKGAVVKGRVRATVIPPFTYRVEPPVPAAPLPVIGTRLLLVAHKDVDASAVQQMVEAVYASEFANLSRPALDVKLLELPPEFPWHGGTQTYLQRNAPVVSGMVMDSAQKGFAIFAAAASGLFVLWQWLKMRSRFLLDKGFNKYIRMVSFIEETAVRLDHEGMGNRLHYIELRDQLDQLKSEALARFTDGELAGHELLLGFLVQVNGVRSLLVHLIDQTDKAPGDVIPANQPESPQLG